MNYADLHWYWIGFMVVLHIWAFLTAKPTDQEVEKLWEDMRGM